MDKVEEKKYTKEELDLLVKMLNEYQVLGRNDWYIDYRYGLHMICTKLSSPKIRLTPFIAVKVIKKYVEV